MPDSIDFEIEFGRERGNTYRSSCRVDFPNNAALPLHIHGTVQFDFVKLEYLRKMRDFRAYGASLRDSLFDTTKNSHREELRAAGDRAAGQMALRMRLIIDDSCPELHALLWETMLDPIRADRFLSTSRGIYVSRVLRHGRPRAFALREKSNIRALVLIADPAPPEDGGWRDDERIILSEELAKALAAVGALTHKIIITDPASPGRASLKNLLSELEKNPYDVLYLVCHGTFDSKAADSALRLEGSDGRVEWVSGKAFVTSFERLPNPPTIAILCSCATAGSGNSSSEDILSALGPRLVQAGVPAVVAMHGLISMDTAKLFFPKFFTELLAQGVVDRAVSIARAEIETQSDFYVPVLFHRLRSGRIWYGDSEQVDQGINWQAHVESLKNGMTTLVLGSALLDPYLGSQAEIATQLSQKDHYAFSDSERDDFAMVCQFIEHVMGRDHLERSVVREYLGQLIREYRPKLLNSHSDEELLGYLESDRPNVPLQRLLKEIWQLKKGVDPISKLARLPFKAYISTNPDTLLETAMPAERKVRKWRCGLAPSRSITNERIDINSQPDPLRPLLVYLQGTFDDPPTMILTEHDYYYQLSEAAKGDSAVVKSLNSIFTGSALIFLGFRLHEWDFRILYRRVQLINGWGANKRFFHVAVQIDPSSARGTGSETVVKMFLSQFLDNPRFEVFRGSVPQFVDELTNKFRQSGGKLYGD